MGLKTTWNVIKVGLIGVVAVIVGYGVLAWLSTAVQEWWLGGVTYHHSSTRTLILAGIFTPATGLFGGFVAGWIGRRAPLVHGLILGSLIGIETTYLYAKHIVDGPLWFEAGAGAALAAAVVVGSWVARRWLRRPAAVRA